MKYEYLYTKDGLKVDMKVIAEYLNCTREGSYSVEEEELDGSISAATESQREFVIKNKSTNKFYSGVMDNCNIHLKGFTRNIEEAMIYTGKEIPRGVINRQSREIANQLEIVDVEINEDGKREVVPSVEWIIC